jgi:hypothetical protein
MFLQIIFKLHNNHIDSISTVEYFVPLTSGVQFWNLSQRMMIKGWQGCLELKDYVEGLSSVWHYLDSCFPSWSPNQIVIDVLGCFQKHHCPNTNLAWMTLHGHFLHVLHLATHKLHCLVLVNPTHALVLTFLSPRKASTTCNIIS